jgi:thymidylate kinase
MHIAIEGLDGVGKTTTCMKLADRIDYKFVEKPLHYLFDTPNTFDNYFRIRDYVNVQTNLKFTSWFYGLGNILTHHLFENENIITDRHLVSNFLWSGDEISRPVFECLIKLIGKPDLTILLYADGEIILERLRKRNDKDKDIKKVHLSKYALEKMENFLKEYEMNYAKIDSSNLTVDEVVNQIMAIARKEAII